MRLIEPPIRRPVFWLLMAAFIGGGMLSCSESGLEPERDERFLKIFGSNLEDQSGKVLLLPNGGYALSAQVGAVANNSENGNVGENGSMQLTLTDSEGNDYWSRLIDTVSVNGVNFVDLLGRSILTNGESQLLVFCSGHAESESELDRAALLLTVNYDLDDVQSVNAQAFGEEERFELLFGVSVTPNGELLTIGSSSAAVGSLNMYALRLTAGGGVIWEREYGTTQFNDIGLSIVENTQNELFWFGYRESFETGARRVRIVKTDDKGAVLWDRPYPRDDSELAGRQAEGSEMIDTGDGLVFVGWTQQAGQPQRGWLAKVGYNGNVVWSQDLANLEGGSLELRGVAAAENGDLFVTGLVSSGSVANQQSIYVARFNRGGGLIWERRYGDTGSNAGETVAPTLDGGCILGATVDFENNRQAALLKLDSDGQLDE